MTDNNDNEGGRDGGGREGGPGNAREGSSLARLFLSRLEAR